MARIKGSKQIITISLDQELVRKVEELASAKDVSRSKMIEDLIETGFDQETFTVQAMKEPAVMRALVAAFSQPDVLRAVVSGLGQPVSEDALLNWNRGIQLLGNYSEAFREGGQPDAVAEKAVRAHGRSRKASKGKNVKR